MSDKSRTTGNVQTTIGAVNHRWGEGVLYIPEQHAVLEPVPHKQTIGFRRKDKDGDYNIFRFEGKEVSVFKRMDEI